MDVYRLLAWRKDNISNWQVWIAFSSIILNPVIAIKLDLSGLLSNQQRCFRKLEATITFEDVLSSPGFFILL